MTLPAECYEKPYNKGIEPKALQPLAAAMTRFFDDAKFYEHMQQSALEHGHGHSIEKSTDRLEAVLSDVILRGPAKRAHLKGPTRADMGCQSFGLASTHAGEANLAKAPNHKAADHTKVSARYSGDRAHRYDTARTHEIKWKTEQRLITDRIAELAQNKSVLDCPVGTGRFLSALQKARANVIGIDESDDMLGEARKKAGALGFPAELVGGDIKNLALPTSSVDGVLCFRLLNWFRHDEVEEALQSLKRVTRYWLLIGMRTSQSAHIHRAAGGTLYLHPDDWFRNLLKNLAMFISEEHLVERDLNSTYKIYLIKKSAE